METAKVTFVFSDLLHSLLVEWSRRESNLGVILKSKTFGKFFAAGKLKFVAKTAVKSPPQTLKNAM